MWEASGRGLMGRFFVEVSAIIALAVYAAG
jgi:hypothetical protein